MSVTRLTPVLTHFAPRAFGTQSWRATKDEAAGNDNPIAKDYVEDIEYSGKKDEGSGADNPGTDG
jgi:hypothetical protein